MEEVDLLSKASAQLRRLFYLVTPAESSFKHVDDVPRYVDDALPGFMTLMLIEFVVLTLQGRPLPRSNDAFSSLAAGMYSVVHSVLGRTVEVATYIWFYDRFNMVALPWDSAWTWMLGMVGVDFLYYWVHRSGHEVNLMWSGHQAHHSSEDYNLSTALRQSAVHRYFNWMIYLPLALFVPPSVFLVHQQFNLLYQFWIHTETVKNLGPLEWIINTPSHHRVHHGRNPYCIDKNYGGTFIIFDRMFGTFQAEEEEVIYGLVHPLSSWDPIYTQLCHLQYIFQKVRDTEGFTNKMSVIFKGPGWEPGKPWTGCIEDIPEVEKPIEKYDRDVPLWTNLYIWLHFGLLLVGYNVLAQHKQNVSTLVIVACILYLLYSLSSFGAMFDHKSYAPLMELSRCVVFVVVSKFCVPMMTSMIAVGYAVSTLYVLSVSLWLYISVRQTPLVKKMKSL